MKKNFQRIPRPTRLALLIAAPWLLAGCASLSGTGGIEPVQKIAEQHLGQSVGVARSAAEQDSAAKRVDELLAKPLSADSAVQIALLNNRGLQASLHALGVVEAEVVQASRMPNPGFSFGRSKKGEEREIERTFGFDLGHLIALPLARQAESRRFAAAQRGTALEMLALAADTRKAFYTAVAAEQTLSYMRDVQGAADAGAELAKRMAQAGNWSRLQQAREHAFFADAALNTARAERARVAARERLTRLLSLWGTQTAFTLPERLADLPGEPKDRPDIEQFAMSQRLDVQAAKAQSEATARNLGLSRVTRFINVLELELSRNSSNEGPRQTGYEISVELPLFDWGGARVARAESVYMQSLQRAAQTAVEARSEVREAYQAYRSSYDIARHYRDEAVPTAKRISEENLLRYNGMFIGVFELLADTRAQIGTVNASIEALRDFWVAQADLDMALIGKPSLAGAAAPSVAGAAAAAH
ncbi:TolC family protein [Roseateles sp. DAIF2]|uniref:TolC family protein n=1 Tax=Roseateles sp. DAIF2 TaxID=2714952 RepID=UPI0018A30F46|nr:TolC family protein [Roseateles sp. DAIF2]QPF74135.1 TolC family protein [Roseateles sp. DAIF2]